MPNFDSTWARQETQSVTGKLRDAVKPQGALKPRIQTAVNKLQVQISKMDSMLSKLQERDTQIFQRVVTAMQQHDTSTLRLTTIHDLGDAMVAIGPAMSTMKGLKSSLGKFMPEADSELNSMTQTLNGLMVDSLAGDSFSGMESDVSNEETDKILQEASAVAEQQIGEKFPSVPSSSGLSSQTSSTSSFE